MKCPKCNSNLMFRNLDGDYECPFCGNILYASKPSVKEDTKAPPSPTVKPVVAYTNETPQPFIPVAATPLEGYEPEITRDQFFGLLAKLCRPIKEESASPEIKPSLGDLPKDARPSDHFVYALSFLREDTAKAFKTAFGKRLSEYGNRTEVAYYAYLEVLIERSQLENIRKELLHWREYLTALPDCQHLRGARMVLFALEELCTEISRMAPTRPTLQIEKR